MPNRQAVHSNNKACRQEDSSSVSSSINRRTSLLTPGEADSAGPLSDEDPTHYSSFEQSNSASSTSSSRYDRFLSPRCQLNRALNLFEQDKQPDLHPEAFGEPHSGNAGWDRGDGWLGRDILITENDNHANKVLSDALESAKSPHPNCRQRLLVVANRLPVSATRKGDVWSLELSAGGLVSALLGVRQFETRWIGWAGVNVSDEVGQIALRKALEEKRCVPVFLDEETVHQYYNGYCNNVLWPLFHYLGLPQEDRLSATRSLEDQFEAYKRANSKFAEVVYSVYREGDVVWCHDYHLMFLPKCLKEYDNNMKVGWFLHTPFPSSEIYRTLPSRSELLKAVLTADLIGFHTYDYARHFVSACTRILGLEGTRSGVEDHPLGRLTRVAAAFGRFDLWLAAENGMFLRHTRGEWKTTMPEHLNMDWMDSVQLVFEYFRERTPRSYVEVRETSLLWNYKYADVEFGRVQARDMLQHLWTGPISNAAVDVVQGGRSVEVRPVGVSKGAAIDRILGEIVHKKRILTPIDYVLCIGHFLSKDEDIYTFFEPELPFEKEYGSNGKLPESNKQPVDRKGGSKPSEKSASKVSGKTNANTSTTGSDSTAKTGMDPSNVAMASSIHSNGSHPKSSNKPAREAAQVEAYRQEGSSVLDLKGENYFSCAVGRKRSNARYSLPSSEDVVSFLRAIASSYKSSLFKVPGWHRE